MDVGIILFVIRITAMVLTSMVTLYALWLGAIAIFGNLIPEKLSACQTTYFCSYYFGKK